MAKAALRSDNQTLHHTIESFGFGKPTGSGLPGEVKGLVNPLPRWNEYSQTSIPMGQEIGVTALQMVRSFAVFANGGYLLKPTIRPVDHLSNRDVVRRVLPKRAADRTRKVLRRVVTDGTGRKAKSKAYRFFGKTGTAQLPNRKTGGYYDSRYMSSFVGGGPVDQPRLVAGCFIRDPDPEVEHYGGLVAAPVVKTVLEKSLQYLGVPAKSTEAEDQQLAAQP
jgi:cell division protein FtsI/penicillin-binding protein 2